MSDINICMAQTVNVVNNWEFCDICTEKEGVNWKCIQCLQHLCERCQNAHIYGKVTMEHRLIPKEEKFNEAELLRMYKCETHEDKNVIMYCKDDKQPVCTECIEDDHQGHFFTSLGKVADDIRGEIKTMKEKREVIETNFCPVEEKYKTRRKILETRREIENVLNACANEMMNEYDRQCQSIEEDYVGFKIDTSEILLCSENLRDVEIIRKSKGIIGSLKPPNKVQDGHRSRLPSVPEFNLPKMELMEKMLQRLSRDTNWVPTVRGGGSSSYCMAVACIYIGICNSFTGISLRGKENKGKVIEVEISSNYPTQLTESCMVVDNDAVIHKFGHGDVEICKHLGENSNHTIFLGPGVMKDGKVFFISEDGISFDGEVLLTSVVRHLKGKVLNTVQPDIQESDIFWQIVLSDVWSEQLYYLTNGIASQLQLENWNICSDSDTCVMYWSTCTEGVPKSVSLTNPCIILEVDNNISISTRILHSDNQTTAPIKPVFCPGFLAIVEEWIAMINLLVGEEASLQVSRGWTFGLLEIFRRQYCHSNRKEFRFWGNSSFFENFAEIVRVLETVLKQASYCKHVSAKRGIVRIKQSFIDRQVKLVMENVCKHISQMLSMPDMSSASAIVLFGHFCSATVVNETLGEAFPSLPILSSVDPYNAVRFGAVNIGWSN